MLYYWFIPKTPKKTKSKAAKGSKARPAKKSFYRNNPLPNALAALLGTSDEPLNLLVSPGYLSDKLTTTKHFFDSFDSLLKKRPNAKGVSGRFCLSFMRGMATGPQETRHLLNHWNELATNNHSFRFCPPIFTRVDSKQNHSKILFLYTIDNGNAAQFLSDLSRMCMENISTGKTEHDVVEEFLKNAKVRAIVIGSSNFSDMTYFGGFKKAFSQGETDVILFESDSAGTNSSFRTIIDFFQQRANGNNVDSLVPSDPPWLEARMNNLLDSALGCGIYSGGKSPADYLNDILREYLSNWTA